MPEQMISDLNEILKAEEKEYFLVVRSRDREWELLNLGFL